MVLPKRSWRRSGHFELDGNVTLSPTAALIAELIGPAAGQPYDRLNVLASGVVNRSNAVLQAIFRFRPTVGSRFDILVSSSGAPLLGQFQELLEEAVFAVNGRLARMNTISP
jgi:hypothetical protein